MIQTEGPMPLGRYMALALGHPTHGYYATRDPLGAAGDFVTAPEVSQMFGELIGLWAAEMWAGLGRPAPVKLVELGPGRGTLMADALRAARAMPAFAGALEVHLVETSPVLAAAQRARLADARTPVRWHEALSAVPPGPAIVLANEFVDALPVFQLQARSGAWHERMVGVSADGLILALAPAPVPGPALPELLRGADAPADGAVHEWRPAGEALTAELAARFAAAPGAALIVDYGHAETGFGDTFQAVRRHRAADPLAAPGEADLTAHVDFAALAGTARGAGAAVFGPMEMGAFLGGLGIRLRAERLAAGAGPAAKADIAAALARLTDPAEMGSLFKVMAIASPGTPPPPPFD
jgi:SAM-dependent MidA family methyltransferase